MVARLCLIAVLGFAASTPAAARVVGKPPPSAPRCGTSTPAPASPRAPRLGRVAVIVMENKACDAVIGSQEAPYLDRLARRYAFASRYYAITAPSLPNYLALIGGSTFGITTNCADCAVRATNVVSQLERARISWKAYMESMPAPCFRGAEHGLYAKRHNPFLYFVDIASSPVRCRHVVPLDRLSRDVRNRSLPRFVWISPNLCHDMHSCPVREGDRFLAELVPPLLAALGPRGVLIVTWDEGADRAGCCRHAAGGNVPTILAGPGARLGGRSSLAYDHYSILRTIEDGWGLPRLRGAACPCTRPLNALLRAR